MSNFSCKYLFLLIYSSLLLDYKNTIEALHYLYTFYFYGFTPKILNVIIFSSYLFYYFSLQTHSYFLLYFNVCSSKLLFLFLFLYLPMPLLFFYPILTIVVRLNSLSYLSPILSVSIFVLLNIYLIYIYISPHYYIYYYLFCCVWLFFVHLVNLFISISIYVFIFIHIHYVYFHL